ncbi:MAG: type 1 glutamine amidotransferase [Candidatus Bruticola sp.]
MFTQNTIKCLVVETRLDPKLIEHEISCLERSTGLKKEQLIVCNALETSLEAGLESGFQAVIIGGTGDFSVVNDRPVFYNPLLKFVRHLCENSFPVLGLCYGHQIIAQAMGGEVITESHERSETGTYLMTLTEAGRADIVLADSPSSFWAQQGHHDAVVSMPDSFIRLAYSDRCTWQAMHLNGKPIYGFQFHPELIRQDLVTRMTAYAHIYASEPGKLDKIIGAIKETDNQIIIRNFINKVVLPHWNI